MGKGFGLAFESEVLSGNMGLGRVVGVSGRRAAVRNFFEEAQSVRSQRSFVSRVLNPERPVTFREASSLAAGFYAGSGEMFDLPAWDLMAGASAVADGGFSPFSSFGSINPADEPTAESAARVAANLAAAGIVDEPLSTPAEQAVNPHSAGFSTPPASVVGSPMANPKRGLGGNVSPLVTGQVLNRQAAETKPKASDVGHSSTPVALKVSAARNEPQVSNSDACVDRPTGNTHGPGKWRGQWFNWCKE